MSVRSAAPSRQSENCHAERAAQEARQKNPKLAQATAEKEVQRSGEGRSAQPSSGVASPASKIDDSLPWDGALGDAEDIMPDAQEECGGQRRHRKKRVVATLQEIGKDAGLTPMKVGTREQGE